MKERRGEKDRKIEKRMKERGRDSESVEEREREREWIG